MTTGAAANDGKKTIHANSVSWNNHSAPAHTRAMAVKTPRQNLDHRDDFLLSISRQASSGWRARV